MKFHTVSPEILFQNSVSSRSRYCHFFSDFFVNNYITFCVCEMHIMILLYLQVRNCVADSLSGAVDGFVWLSEQTQRR